MLATREDVNTGRRKEAPPVSSREQPSHSVEGHKGRPSARGAGGAPWAMVSTLAARKGIDATLGDQCPPYRSPALPCCYASDIKVSKSRKEAMQSVHAHIWERSMGWEFYGLLEVGLF